MLIKKMSVNLSNQDPTVFVPQPLGNRHEIDAGHDTKRAKQMSEIVKTNAWQIRLVPHQVKGLS
jgi:hypothetical protein